MEKINRLRERFHELGVDGMMIIHPWNRLYISGFTGSNGVILISETEAKLITDYRYFEQAQNQAENFDIVLHAGHTGHKGKIFEEVIVQAKEMNISKLGFEQEHLSYGLFKRNEPLFSAKLVPTYDVIEKLRMIKSKEEIQKLRVAAEVTDKAYLHILNFIKAGISELDVAAELELFIKKNDCTNATFSPTVVSGYRSSMPHGRASDKIIEKGDMITIDFGANYQGYWADISRVVSIGEPAPELRKLHDIVLTSFENCVANLRPGLTDQEVDFLMRENIIKHGFNEQSGTGTGHGIGLEVHEAPLFSVLKEKVLEENMVITVEPGIYLKGLGGARVEDMILITENGREVLTPSTKELIIL
ncbi:Xaa-Pro peptidase family protein [Bacillus sp. DTU_2020_1000418_1_SI_GHA_SEK_038]|uniref:M24 family metallopeptidase n=1 Tax=Bacillus sp. DTU_2020_1000418_1_SI_GHA_SEK_038 TaxID=3077585 RepID=UPI0028EBEF1C|nr:Xaa-Pro peptidase family protein [Bacillus sp. DTU_2020_1000418_1_SI_GHA_SEK_038]WNS74731.1 Xaa-Pro peptidase family protein [Bacillus sp. DTU_2020_1000418_1_SI_GHA_SEK_038]